MQSASLSERTTKILDGGATTADLSEIEQIVKERMVRPFMFYLHKAALHKVQRVSLTGATHRKSGKA